MSAFLRDLFASVAEGRRWRSAGDTGPASVPHLVGLADALLSGRGEASGVALATEFLNLYRKLDHNQKTEMLRVMAERFGPNQVVLQRAARAYVDNANPAALHDLQVAAEPSRQELLRLLNLAPGGTEQLVRMREDLLTRLDSDRQLASVDDDFVHLFSSWFNRGFLVLRRIDWHTPAIVLERIIRYEAVHEIRDWNDLKRRIDLPDRRLYAFFHPALVDDPLIFVQVALMDTMPGSISPVLASDRATLDGEAASTAVFYSITSTQNGLRGISFGNFLIKQVVEDLAREFPGLKTFVTLSPVPSFTRWLQSEIAGESELVRSVGGKALLGVLEEPGWASDTGRTDALAETIPALAAHYFVNARTPDGRVIDPVARFHLGNGARLERINWLADTSPKGLAHSASLMVNYCYELKTIERNHEAFANESKVVTSPSIQKLLKLLPARTRHPVLPA